MITLATYGLGYPLIILCPFPSLLIPFFIGPQNQPEMGHVPQLCEFAIDGAITRFRLELLRQVLTFCFPQSLCTSQTMIRYP